MSRRALLVLVPLLALWFTRPAPARPRTAVLFQAFPWDAAVDGQKHVWYRHLKTKAPELARAGITHVWYPPVSRSVAAQGYLPSDLYDLGEGDELGHNRTLYGNRAELEESLAAFRRLGVETVADVVLNHRCASHQEDGVWNVFHHPSGGARWERWALAEGDYAGTGAPDSGEDFAAAPDVDHENPRVRADLTEWLRWLRHEVGFDGLRFDFTKGYAPRFAAGYARAAGATFAVGEYWTDMAYDGSDLRPVQDAHRQRLADWVDGTGGAVSTFDFTTKGQLQAAAASGDFSRMRAADGRASGFLGWWPARAVTFVDNHDTGSKQAHWPFPAAHVPLGYAYILSHPGTPTVFWDHLYAWGPELKTQLKAMIRLRHEAGVHAESPLKIVAAKPGLYAAVTGGRLAVRLGNGAWHPGDGWHEALAGPGYTLWTRAP